MVLAALLLLSGCKKKKPVVPPQAQAPTVIEQMPAQPAPPPNAQPAPPPTTTQPAPEAQEKIVTKPKPKPKRRNPQVTKHTPPAPKPADNATATAKADVPPANNSAQPEISVSMDQAQLARRKQLTEELLQSTDADLKSINRTLTGDETAMVEQARSYMTQSRAAIQDGDLDRAGNLAQKAHLLAQALTKP
jgi:outer membrane biosynthesis protein TonB